MGLLGLATRDIGQQGNFFLVRMYIVHDRTMTFKKGKRKNFVSEVGQCWFVVHCIGLHTRLAMFVAIHNDPLTQ